MNGFSPLCESLVENGSWWPKPYSRAILESRIIDGGVSLSHDGFARATRVTKHVRELNLKENGLLLVDSFEGEGEVDIQLCWNFGEVFDSFDKELKAISGVGGQVKMAVSGFLESPIYFSSYGGPEGGAISTDYGEFNSSLNVKVYGSVSLPAVILTSLEYKKCVA